VVELCYAIVMRTPSPPPSPLRGCLPSREVLVCSLTSVLFSCSPSPSHMS
jgi:hypothetical protein